MIGDAARSSSIDPTRLDMLRSLDPDGTRQLLKRTIMKFVDYCDETLSDMAKAISSRQVSEVARMAHSLKSSSASLGAVVLSGQCAELEETTKGGFLPDDVDARLTALTDAHQKARQALLQMIEDGKPSS